MFRHASTPPQPVESFPGLFDSPSLPQDEKSSALWQGPPRNASVEDPLAKQVAALEQAKSLAAAQQAWNQQQIATRQDQLRREAQEALARAQEMQADVFQGWPGLRPSSPPQTVSAPSTETQEPTAPTTPSAAAPLTTVTAPTHLGFVGGPTPAPPALDEALRQLGTDGPDTSLPTLVVHERGPLCESQSISSPVDGPAPLSPHPVESGLGHEGNILAEHLPGENSLIGATSVVVDENLLERQLAEQREVLAEHDRAIEAERNRLANSGPTLAHPGTSNVGHVEHAVPHPHVERHSDRHPQYRGAHNNDRHRSASQDKHRTASHSPTNHHGPSQHQSRDHSPAYHSAHPPAMERAAARSPARQRPPEQRPPEPDAGPELDRAFEIMNSSLDKVTPRDLRELRSFQRPPAPVKAVVEAIALLLGVNDDRWGAIKRVLAGNAIDKLRAFKAESVTRDGFRKLRKLLALPEFDEEQIRSHCVSAVNIANWVRSVGFHLSRTKYKGGPEVRPATVSQLSPAAPAEPQTNGTAASRAFEPEVRSDLIIVPDVRWMTEDQLRNVLDLTVTRPNVGSITFKGITNCVGMNLQRLVKLEVGEVLVYPEPGTKPQIGQGLNKQATVTMYQCWPPNGRGNLEDPKAQDRYRRKIQQMTEKKNARFLDYDCSTGVWKFQVEHF